MRMADLGDLRLQYQLDGDPEGSPLVLIHALGTDLRLWDKLVPLLPRGLRILRFSLRGHGLSDAPPAPYAMGALVRDAERLMDHLRITDAVIVGLSIGGMIAQGLAVKRLDLVRGLVLSNTAAKIGTTEIWHDRIARIEAGGIEAVADATMDRWFAPAFRATAEARGYAAPPFTCLWGLHHQWGYAWTDDGHRFRQCCRCGLDDPRSGGTRPNPSVAGIIITGPPQ